MRPTIAATLVAASLAAAGPAVAGDEKAQAMLAYENGQYVHAANRLRAAAQKGDAHAAEVLGFMYGFGAAVYPGMVRDLHAARHWFDLAARGGRPVGRYMFCALSKRVAAAGQPASRCFDWVAEIGQPGPR